MVKSKKTLVFAFYILAFYAVWAVFELFISDFLNSTISNTVLCALVTEGIIKNCVWTIPAIMLVKHCKNDMYIPLEEMFRTKCSWLPYLPLFLLFTGFVLTLAILQNGQLRIVDNFGLDTIIVILFVGLTEEMVFRGWLLNATFHPNKKWQSIMLNAVMFLAIHFPIWIANGVLISSFTSLGFLSVLALSIIFSWAFLKSKNILVPIALHMYWDLLVFMFIG